LKRANDPDHHRHCNDACPNPRRAKHLAHFAKRQLQWPFFHEALPVFAKPALCLNLRFSFIAHKGGGAIGRVATSENLRVL
jgi:hypothetical protein